MLQFLSKESEVGSTLLKYLQLKKDFHDATAKQISEKIEHFQRLLNAPTVATPIFGCGLDEHLKKQGHGVCIGEAIFLFIISPLDCISSADLVFFIARGLLERVPQAPTTRKILRSFKMESILR